MVEPSEYRKKKEAKDLKDIKKMARTTTKKKGR